MLKADEDLYRQLHHRKRASRIVYVPVRRDCEGLLRCTECKAPIRDFHKAGCDHADKQWPWE